MSDVSRWILVLGFATAATVLCAVAYLYRTGIRRVMRGTSARVRRCWAYVACSAGLAGTAACMALVVASGDSSVIEVIRLCVATGIFLVAFASTGWVCHRRRSEGRTRIGLCPMCLGADTLGLDDSFRNETLSVICSNVLDSAGYQECGFAFPATVLRYVKK